MQIVPIREGQKAVIVALKDAKGNCQVLDFLQQISVPDRKKVFFLFDSICIHGVLQNTEKFKKEKEHIWTFKSYQIRILCFLAPNARQRTYVLTHAFLKKKNKMDDSELKKAERLFEEYSRKDYHNE
ncbi:MAG TPA: type II toxin-antitoxin system RelE/ParE family toxin [Bacteroidota bacterium]|nr:type II toxin-antitoxin system RelE/ParE family toxin [Bacteroidota bacterium]